MSAVKPIVVVGSINQDLVVAAPHIPGAGETIIGTDFQVHPGGKGANQAVAVARLGYPVHMIGRLGDDAVGAQMRAHLQQSGVGTEAIGTSEGASGVALIVVSAKGENSIVVAPGANAKLTPQDIEANLALIKQAGIVLAQLETPLDTVEALALICARADVPLMLDPAPAQQLPASVLKSVAWITPNETEAAFYAHANAADVSAPAAIARALFVSGCRGVVLKLGSRGAYLANAEGKTEQVPAFAVHAIDSTAAGDAFNGAFAVGLMLGKSPGESAVFAAAVAAISVTRRGAQPSMPTMDEVETFMQSRQ